MRNEANTFLKNELRSLAIKTRARLKLTQKEMAVMLVMNESSYSKIETGKVMCGTLTAMILVSRQEYPDVFLQDLWDKLKEKSKGGTISK